MQRKPSLPRSLWKSSKLDKDYWLSIVFVIGVMFWFHFLLAEETSVLLGITDNRLELKIQTFQ